MIDATVKSLISFRYSFLFLHAHLETNHAEVIRIVMDLGEGVQHLKMLSAN